MDHDGVIPNGFIAVVRSMHPEVVRTNRRIEVKGIFCGNRTRFINQRPVLVKLTGVREGG